MLARASSNFLLGILFFTTAAGCGKGTTPVILPADMHGKSPDMTGQAPRDFSVVGTDDAAVQEDGGVEDAAMQQADLRPDDAGAKPDLRVVHDLSVVDLRIVHDLSTPDLIVVRDFLVPPGEDLASPVCHVVVNELMTGTTQTGTEEFIEIYNQCATAIDLSGWTLVYRAGLTVAAPGAAGDDATLYTWANRATIPANGYLVYADSGYKGHTDGKIASGIKDGTGSVGIRDGKGNLIDSVGYTSVKTPIAPANAFIEGKAATAPPTVSSPGISIGRLPNGRDLDDNSSDFSECSAITPGAENQ